MCVMRVTMITSLSKILMVRTILALDQETGASSLINHFHKLSW